MPQRSSPKRFHDISHLFLSKSGYHKSPREQHVEACVWLAVLNRSLNRAYLAAGTGVAFAQQQMHVSLLEIGRGLPNIGYYFARVPSAYIVPTLDETFVLSGRWNSSLVFVSAVALRYLSRFKLESDLDGFPHIIVEAFTYPIDTDERNFFIELAENTARISGCGECHRMAPDGLVIFGDGGDVTNILSTIRAFAPETQVFLAQYEGSTEIEATVHERIPMPVRLGTTMSRRMPPTETFFADLASTVLQVLSYRRKGIERNAFSG